MDFQFPVIPHAFNVMLKPVGPICNLNCGYCYYTEKTKLFKNQESFFIEFKLLDKFTKEYIDSQKASTVNFIWQGGEPTILGLEFFKKAIELQQKHSSNIAIKNILQTNGLLLDKNFCRFLKENNFLVGISIDGPDYLHDYYRKDLNGIQSWTKVMNGINLLKEFEIDFNTMTTVNRLNANHPLEVYHFLKHIGSKFIQFTPVVERHRLNAFESALDLVHQKFSGPASVTSWSLLPDQLGLFLNSIFNEWVQNDVGSYFIQMFDAALANWVGVEPSLCTHSSKCGFSAVMEFNGNIYSCDHFVYPDYFIGNLVHDSLRNIIGSVEQSFFGQSKIAYLPDKCLGCEVKFACWGGCIKHRFASSSNGENNLNYLCPSYKSFFNHIAPFMDYMSKELISKRYAANVMSWNEIKFHLKF